MKQNEMNSQKAQKLTKEELEQVKTGPASSSGEQEAVSLTL